MKKATYNIKGIDCANCAAKLERKITKLRGVEDCSISFMTQKMYLEAEESVFNEVLKKALSIIKKHEPECEVTEV